MTSDELLARIKSLDLPTKVRLLTGASAFTLHPEPSIGLGEMRFSDGPTGVRGLKFSGGPVVALFPNATLLSSAWDEDEAYEFGRLLAEEAMALGIHVVLGPTINLHRTPLGGRLFEAYSEDPLLTGRIAAAYVRGIQSLGVGACLKHLIANESETDRNTVDSVVDEATLREVYLLPFEIAVSAADPWTIMAAYNDVNGVPSTEQAHVNNDIVKDEWGYRGLIMSDWFATKSAGPAANGGLDLVMPGPDGPWGDALVAAVRSGEVDESVIDDHLGRLLLLAQRTGALGTPRTYPPGLPAPASPVRREQLTRVAASGMTVLTNNDSTLPLDRSATLAVIGRHAVETIGMGGGSAQVNPPYQVSVAAGLTSLLGSQVTVVDGVEVRSRPVPARDGFFSSLEAVIQDADGAELERRLLPQARTVIGMDDEFPGKAATVCFRGVIAGSDPAAGPEPAELGVIGVGDWQLSAGSHTSAVSLAVGGNGFGEEILAPPAHTFVVPVSPGDVFEATVTLGPGFTIGGFAVVGHAASRETVDVIDDAVRAAAAADVAVVVVGLTEEQETESVDKATLHLPGAQNALVEAVAGAARRTVVVVNAATPVIMPWLSRVDAVLWAGLPGQEGGHAVAAALLGDIEPAGRLVTSFPTDDGKAPAWSVTPVGGKLVYDEGRFVGYRGHFGGRAPEPVFWLGHGLGYATWEYSDVRLVLGDAPAIHATVRNTGRHTSREVVQVYLRPVEPDEPVRLVGWTAVTVEPGKSARVTVRTDRRLWRRWDADTGSWGRIADGGTFLVARGLGDIRASVS